MVIDVKGETTMRVFDIYSYNLIDIVKFKDTKPYIDNMLRELGLNYNNVFFEINEFITKTEDVLKKYPKLEKYKKKDTQCTYEEKFFLTSLTTEWTKGKLYADKEDWDDVFAIVSKVPRGMNVLPVLILDEIDWYGEGVKEAAYDVQESQEQKVFTHAARVFENSSITMVRGYDHGNKMNYLSVSIESTTDGIPRDTTDIINMLEPYLGKPICKTQKCMYSKEENKTFRLNAGECSKMLEESMEEFYPKRYESPYAEFIPKLADINKIKKAFKNTDFKVGDRKGLLPGMNQVICIDEHNYFYEVIIDRTQNMPNCFCLYITVEGCNFRISNSQKVVYAYSEEESLELLYKFAEFCMEFKEKFGKVLEDRFGNTPEWYKYDR